MKFSIAHSRCGWMFLLGLALAGCARPVPPPEEAEGAVHAAAKPGGDWVEERH